MCDASYSGQDLAEGYYAAAADHSTAAGNLADRYCSAAADQAEKYCSAGADYAEGYLSAGAAEQAERYSAAGPEGYCSAGTDLAERYGSAGAVRQTTFLWNDDHPLLIEFEKERHEFR